MAAIQTDAPPPSRRGPYERAFFTGAAIVAAIVVFGGFSQKYYLKAFFDSPALPSVLVHAHGLVMTAWFALLLVQVRLVAAGNLGLHRRLGIASIGLVFLLVVVSTMTALYAAKAGRGPPGPPPLAFLAIPLMSMVIFTSLYAAALACRRTRTDFHKRWMVLASLAILTPAIARIPFENGGVPLFFGLTDAILVAAVAIDTIRNRRLHPAFGWGLPYVLLLQGLGFAIAFSPRWQALAKQMTDAI